MAAAARSAAARLGAVAEAATRRVYAACEAEAAKGTKRGLVEADATWDTTKELASKTYYTAMKTCVAAERAPSPRAPPAPRAAAPQGGGKASRRTQQCEP